MNSDAVSLYLGVLGQGAEVDRPRPRHVHADPGEQKNWIEAANSTMTSSLADQGSSQLDGPSDESLFLQFGKGDKEALSVLFRRYARIVRVVAYRILRDSSEADDLLQDVFLFIFRKWTLFDSARGSARSWIVQVTYHRAIDRRRHLISRHFYSSLELEDSALGRTKYSAEVAFYERSIEGVLGKILLGKIDECLSEDQRKTIHLYFFEGYTLEEIAEKSGQSLGNIRNHYYRGLEKMRQIVFTANLRAK